MVRGDGQVSTSTPWPLAPYEKIADSLAGWLGDDEAAYRAASRVEWSATEKIHGACFSLVTDGVTFRAAKRKAFLDEGEDFFGHRELVERLAPRVIDLFARLRARDASIALAYVYGELFGGGYPHPDVPPVPAVQPVQTGCWYAPGIELCAFDLGVVRAGQPERAYVDLDEATRLFQESGLLSAKPLLRGRYEDVAALPLGFETTIPAALGLPSLGPSNRAEGVVLKPTRALTVPRRPGSIRPVVKRKIPEFSEDKRFQGAEKWAAAPARGSAVSALALLQHEASMLVNENRLLAAISKVGRVTPGDTARLAEVRALVIDDLHTELRAHHGGHLRALAPVEAEALERFVEGEAQALVDLHLDAT